MSIVRFGLIGCGNITKKHVVAIRRISKAELAAVCDINEERARTLGKEYNIPFYTDYQKMLKNEKIDVASVLTPTGSHTEHVMDLVNFCKNIIVEKPIASSLADADAIIQCCDKAGVRLFVVKQNRYNRPIQALRQALVSRRFGKLVLGSIRLRWNRTQAYYEGAKWRSFRASGGGVLTNQASHHIDILQWMMGEIESVNAITATRLADIEAEDTAVAILRFKSGALGVIEATTGARPEDLEGSISILGEKGSVVVGGFAMDRLLTWKFSEPQPEDHEIFKNWGENPKEFAWNHTECVRNIVESIQGKTHPLVDGLEARKSLELLHRIYESAETRREVIINSLS